MFDIGLSEIIVIMIIALLVIGPKKLPDVARAMGKGLAEFKRALNNVKDELNVDQYRSEVNDFKNSLLFGKDDEQEPQKQSPNESESQSKEEPGASEEKSDPGNQRDSGHVLDEKAGMAPNQYDLIK